MHAARPILGVDTTTSRTGLAVLARGEILAEITLDPDLSPSTCFLPSLGSLLETAGLTLQELGAFAVTVGPGSFTGIRVGLATIGGLAWATGRQAVGVSTGCSGRST